MKDLIVYHRHMRAMLYCNRGQRFWFAEQGLDWADFLENGIPAATLAASGDAMALAAVAYAQKEAAE